MNSSKEAIIQRIDDVLERSKKFYPVGRFKTQAELTNIYVEMLQTIFDLSFPGSQYREVAKEKSEDELWTSVIGRLRGVLMSLRHAYIKGYLKNINELIDADIFSDILEQAEYLRSQKYHRAAAVVSGVALESHIRKLAERASISVTNDRGYAKAEFLNTELYKREVIDKTFSKSITSWLDLRNRAAHPDPKEIDEGLIESMIMGIRNLIEKYPA